MRWSILWTLVVVGSLAPASSYCEAEPLQTRRLPDGELSVAYRQLEDGKLGDGVIVATLVSTPAGCELLTANLNWCLHLPGTPNQQRKSQLILLNRYSTDDGSLEVLSASFAEGKGLLVLKMHKGTAEVTYRFVYAGTEARQGSTPTMERLTGFDGAGIQLWPDAVESWSLVPFKGTFAQWTPDCPIALPGVPAPAQPSPEERRRDPGL